MNSKRNASFAPQLKTERLRLSRTKKAVIRDGEIEVMDGREERTEEEEKEAQT